MNASERRFEDIFFSARDGIRLHARYYPAQGQPSYDRRPVLCLPGLTRNGRDFTVLAETLSKGPDARDVYTFDYRGRGLSAYGDWKTYAVPIEMLDVADFMAMRGLAGAGIVGTSRGGLITMVMATAQPSLIGAVVLNDIGPVVETKGLSRISAYVGRIPIPATWAEATDIARRMNAKAFPAIPDIEWESIARQLFNERDGKPAPGYDPHLSRSMSVLDGPMPALWPQFEALKRTPMLVIRGERSDILSVETVETMRGRHPRLSAITIPNEGHAPWLRDAVSIAAIRQFFDTTEDHPTARERAYA